MTKFSTFCTLLIIALLAVASWMILDGNMAMVDIFFAIFG